MSRFVALVASCLLTASVALAQDFPQPQASPRAVVTQTVGLTEVTVDYHAPNVKGRKIWGQLVPYDQVWRAGANENTTITFSDSVRVGGKPVPAGKYSVYVLPSADHEWQLILNKVTTHWGAEGYKEADDLLRLPVLPETAPMRETLGYWFSDVRPGAARLNLSWEERTLSVSIRTDVNTQVVRAMKKAVEAKPDNPQLLAQAADYLIQNQLEAELALQYINRAIALNDTYTNNWLKAKLLAQKEDYMTAVAFARRAIKMGDKDDESFKTQLPTMRAVLTQWQAKAY
ncbi:DUF2911 domain-containing protein [Hymenobacter busanensis]|uniref:DUF2911 domain-containing protein n=1 Tax=Hymenobacter busanensis TaxID=2607656 RepID=A0A7L4ZY87_9BACT|nr:DUF2911 domain-containing protein [Hymenobacter busanensis]KAA9339847.1 DUF2911 domain-containing protein [Hymenobacter busanensis]QHJ06400.1 DUF2911 domain-containing protein [Hymenobacter busanensis]